jgi:hypothetical protein
MADNAGTCALCGTTLTAEGQADDVSPVERMPCPNPDCPGKWTATEPGGDGGVRTSYDVGGLRDDASVD